MTLNCLNCGKPFEVKTRTAKFDSVKCRVAYSRKAPGSLPPPSVPATYDREANLKAFQKMGLETVSWITTGIADFDALTQIPRGRVTQIQGPYGVGKTTLCLNMIKGLKGYRVLYIDSESALNPELLVDLEVDAANFVLYNSSAFIEDIYEVIIGALETAKYDMIIFDSLAACTFRTEAANSAADANIGQKAKIVNKLMRIIPMELKRTNTALVIINQERELIGGYVPQKYTPGGMGVPYGASLMVSLKTTKGARFPKSGPPFQGQAVTAEIIKSKVNEPWRKATFNLYYGGNHASRPTEKGPQGQGDQEDGNISSSPAGDNQPYRKPVSVSNNGS